MIQEVPDDIEARIKLSDWYRESNNMEKALQVLEQQADKEKESFGISNILTISNNKRYASDNPKSLDFVFK